MVVFAGLNIGGESYGKGDAFMRPVLILKKLSADLCIVLPLTTQDKKGSWFIDISLLGEKRWVMLNQIRMVHKKRLQHKIGKASKTDFNRVKEKLEALLELSLYHHPTFVGIEGISPKSNLSIADGIIGSIECSICNEKEAFIAEYFNSP